MLTAHPRLAGAVCTGLLVLGLESCDAGTEKESTDEPVQQTVDRPDGDTTITSAVDGDTLHIEVDGGEERVRLIGINAPEDGECFADEATALLAELIDGHTVRLVADETDRDQFGRLLRYVYVGGRFVNEVLVQEGAARSAAYPPDTAEQPTLDAAERTARDAGTGLWADGACGAAAEQGAGDVRIDAVVADPPGPDEADPNAETVTIVNAGEATADLSGWVLKDTTASHRFTFPSGFTLGPGERVLVHTGCGTPTDTDLYWCNSGSLVWNNSGDTAYLEDEQGNTVSVADV